MHIRFWSENLQERDHSEGVDVDGRITLDWTLRKPSGKVWYVDRDQRLAAVNKVIRIMKISPAVQ
jgi:hypothetical protein